MSKPSIICRIALALRSSCCIKMVEEVVEEVVEDALENVVEKVVEEVKEVVGLDSDEKEEEKE